MEIIFLAFILAGVVAFVANSKGRSGGLWFLYGLIIFPIALIHALVLTKSVEALELEKQRQGNIRCSNCADWVFKDAKVCPHCKHSLTDNSRIQAAALSKLSKTVRENLIIEEAESSWQGERNLSAASYKIFLSEKYGIKKNELFDKFVCLDEMFDTLDDAVAYADEADQKEEAGLKAEAERKKSEAVVSRGMIGPRKAFSFEEYASGEVLVSHPVAGLSKKFPNQEAARTYLLSFVTIEEVMQDMWNEKPN